MLRTSFLKLVLGVGISVGVFGVPGTKTADPFVARADAGPKGIVLRDLRHKERIIRRRERHNERQIYREKRQEKHLKREIGQVKHFKYKYKHTK